MNLKSTIPLMLIAVFSNGCATIMKAERTPVRFTGGASAGETKLNLPDGQYNLSNGQTTVLVTRSKADIPFSVTCNSQTREGVIRTSYDALAGIAGNIVFGGIIGIGIDAVGNKTYDPPENFNLAPYCASGGAQEANASIISKDRIPSSK